MKARQLRPGNHHPLPPLPSSSPKGREQGEGRGGPRAGGGGLPTPPPVER